MKAHCRLYKIFIYIVLFSIIPTIAMAEPVKIAILPFAIHADKDYTFLQEGIVQMLTSRLSDPGKVTVIDPVATDEAVAAAQKASGDDLVRQVGLKLNADRTIHGSLTVLGDSVSIDAKMIDVTGVNPPLTFFKQTQGMGNVIGQINLMAADINRQAFGIEPPASSKVAVAAPTAVAAMPPTSAPVQPSPPDIHMHPEKLIQSGRAAVPNQRMESPLVASQTAAPTGSPPVNQLNPAFITSPGMQTQGQVGFWKSRNYPALINGIDVGDVDGDGQMETVVAMPEKVMIYRFSQGRQQTVAEIETSRWVRNISVSIGDINGNGTLEIFVTAFTVAMDALQSSVLEYDGSQYRPIVEGTNYYYNVIQDAHLGSRLIGQSQSAGSDPFFGAIFEMEWKGVNYEPVRKILPSRKANVLGLTIGDITEAQEKSIIILGPRDHLRVMLPNGKTEWRSEDKFGGTTLYFAAPPTSPDQQYSNSYLPIRLRAIDFNHDGQFEVLTAKNHGSTGRVLETQRYFSKSHIVALRWDGLGLVPAWQTRQLSGRVQDFVVADFYNDGTTEILAAVISKEGAIIFTDARSTLIAFDLNLPAK